jgi:hypothetical protein
MFPSAPASELELTPAPLAFVGEQLSPSPFHFRFTGEDALELASYNSQSGVRIAVQGRMWDPVEGIRPFAFSHLPATDRSRGLERFGIANGYLLNVVVFASAGAPRVGQTYISLHVTRGQGAARYLLATLLQGYVTAEQELGFPGSPLVSSIEGAPYTRFVIGTDVVAGASPTESVPTGARWRLRAISLQLSTSAAAGARRPVLFLRDASGYIVAASPTPNTIGASSLANVYWMLGLPVSSTISVNQIIAGLPDVTLLPGGNFLIQAENFDAGDNWTAPTFFVDEWLEA